MAGDRPKRARAGACQNCRVRKKRCVPADDKDDECQLCQSLGIPCSLSQNPGQPVPPPIPAPVRSFPSFPVREELPSPAPKPLQIKPIQPPFREKKLPKEPPRLDIFLTPELAVELISFYFRFIHNVGHTLFHEASFMTRLKEGRASVLHIHAMCALAARFSRNRVFDEIAPHARGKGFASTAITLFQQQTVYASLQSVQACVLVATLLGGEGDKLNRQAYSKLARQHAEVLSLWATPDGLGVIEREERRRTWLSVCILDHWTLADMSVDLVLPPGSLEIIPAVDDVAFHTYHPELLREDASPTRCNLWGQLVRALDTYTGVRGLLRRLSRGLISFDTYRTEVTLWRQTLERWVEHLPSGMTYNINNITSFATQGLGRSFLSLNIGYYHFQQMLHFPFLDTRAGHKTSQLGYGATQCRNSANMVSEIIQSSTGIKDCDLNYFLHGHIVMISSCVHLYTLLFGEDSSELWATRRRLLSNFEYLMRLKRQWPVVEHYVKQLRIFQTLCQSSISDPFASDNWMARFLTEDTSILSERQSLLHGSGVDSDDEACIAGPTEKVETNGSYRSRLSESTYHKSSGPEWSTLSSLLNDQSMTSEAFVNNALGCLLE